MANQPDLSLPGTVPEMEQYHDQGDELLPFACYALCDLSNETLENYRETCLTGTGDDEEDDDEDEGVVKLPPEGHFRHETLRSIVKYHVELCQSRSDEYDPRYFIVFVYPESKAVLLVTLDDDDLECKPDSMWVKMSKSGLLAVNLQIDNTDWSEAKERDLGGPRYSSDDDDDGGGSDADEADEDEGGDGDEDDQSQVDENGSLSGEEEEYGEPGPTGFHIQLYTVEGVDEDELASKVELHTSTSKKRKRTEQTICKLYRPFLNPGNTPTKQAAIFHPRRCVEHPTLQRKYFLIADEPDFLEKGLQIVRLDWDGDISNRNPEQLLDIGRQATFEVQRADAPANGFRAAVDLVCLFAQGHQRWLPDHKQFAVYSADYEDSQTALTEAVDPRWAKRKHGEDRVAPGGSMEPGEPQGPGKGMDFWPALVKKHMTHCDRLKFVPNFARQYFIWSGEKKPSKKSQVLLVRLDWDGRLESSKEVIEAAASKITTMQAAASEAHTILTDIVEGGKAWDGKPLEP